jgi:hypothetical protein
MKKHSVQYFIIIALFFFFGILGIVYGLSTQKVSEKTLDIMPIIKNYSKKIQKEKNITLRLYGFRCAGRDKVYDGKIHEIDLGYSIDKSLKFDEARAFFYNILDELIELINNDPKTEKHFYHFPIDYSDFHIFLSFDYEEKGILEPGEVSSIHISENDIFYVIIDNQRKYDKLKYHKMSDDVYQTELEQNTICIHRSVAEDLKMETKSCK